MAVKHRYLSNLFIGNSFVSAYSKLGMLRDAQQVFDGMPLRNSVSWNALISGCAKYGSHENAAKIYHSMKVEGFQLNEEAFVLMLNSCRNNGDIQIGKQIHADARNCGYESKVLVGSALVNMYAKCGDLENALHVFDSMPERTVVSWNAIISGYVKTGKGREALRLYQQMKKADLRLTDFTFIFLLKACGSLADIEQGKQIHADIIESGIAFNVFLGTALVDMYAKCGDVGRAQEIFDKMPSRNEVSFAALISGHCKNRNHRQAIRCYMQMRQEGFKPHGMTLISVLHACSITEALEEGRQIHADVIKCGFEFDVVVTTALVDMYCRCHRLPLAREVFDKMPHRTVVAYTAVIAAYAKNAAGEEALRLYDEMKKDGIKPEFLTFVFVLNACASMGNLEKGKRTHAEILEAGLESHVTVGSALVDMYSKCGSLTDSRRVFDKMPTRNEHTWTSMIAGYAKHEDFEEAFRLYRQMTLEGLKPDAWTFVCVLNVCAQIGSLQYGKEVHEHIHKAGYETDATVSKSLTIMYSKCGSPETAQAQRILQEV
ncbi:hypothetical protein O6H91_04G091300 [Diphasiastrum complanatum]|nr:hypothetical protein O6H91_04G091300 [Diphasiastrum complanatum]